MKRFFTLLFTIYILCGCSDEFPERVMSERTGVIAVELGDDEFKSKAVVDDTKFGVYAYESNEYEWLHKNLEYKYSISTGALTPLGVVVDVPSPYSEANLYVYAPYSAEVGVTGTYDDPAINIDVVTDQATHGTASSDYMWGNFNGYKTGAKGQIEMTRKFSKIIVNLISETGDDLSSAKVNIGGLPIYAMFNLYNGKMTTTTTQFGTYNAYALGGNSFEVIFPSFTDGAPNFEIIKKDGAKYTYKSPVLQFRDGGVNTYTIKVKDKNELPFTVKAKYGGNVLGDNLSLGAKYSSVDFSVEFSIETSQMLKIRSKDGSPCWVKTQNESSYFGELIFPSMYKCKFIAEENLGAQRTIVIEFYNNNFPKFVHKTVTITQDAATNYFTLGTPSLGVDMWGNIYDRPELLQVSSNELWSVESDVKWAKVEGYNSGAMNQTLKIIVEKNETGVSRNGKLTFKNGDVVVGTYYITQSNTENKSFSLKYELNFVFLTTDNKFRRNDTYGNPFYVGRISVFDRKGGDRSADIYSYSTYGFVTDAPASANRIEVNNFKSDYFIWDNYSGKEVNITDNDTNLLSAYNSETFFRQIRYTLPAPKDVKRNQKVKFFVTVDNVQGTSDYGKITITNEIVNQ